MEFVLYKGKIIRESEFNPGSLWWENEMQFRQEMWFANGEIAHFSEHLQIFDRIFGLLQRPLPREFTSQSELLRLIKRLINKNKAFMGGWVILRYFFDGERPEYAVSVRSHPERLFPLDTSGRMGVISPFFKSSRNPLSPYSFFSETLWKTEKLRSGSNEAIFLNEKGFATESNSANIFFIRKDLLITPSEETGCVLDIMRHYVLQSAGTIGFRIQESPAITPSELTEMEEIFTVSEGNGFRWLKGMGGKRFLKGGTELIWRQVNKGLMAQSVQGRILRKIDPH